MKLSKPSTEPSMKLSITFTKQSDLPRDLRLQVQTLRNIGWKYFKIAEHLKIMIRQVQYVSTHRPTSQKRQCERKLTIDVKSLQILIDFVCASQENRQLSYCQISWKLEWDVSEDAIRWALQKKRLLQKSDSKKVSHFWKKQTSSISLSIRTPKLNQETVTNYTVKWWNVGQRQSSSQNMSH